MNFRGAPLPGLLLLPHSDPANRRSTRVAKRNGREYELRRRYQLPHMSSLRDSRRPWHYEARPKAAPGPRFPRLRDLLRPGAETVAVIQSPALTRGRGRNQFDYGPIIRRKPSLPSENSARKTHSLFRTCARHLKRILVRCDRRKCGMRNSPGLRRGFLDLGPGGTCNDRPCVRDTHGPIRPTRDGRK